MYQRMKDFRTEKGLRVEKQIYKIHQKKKKQKHKKKLQKKIKREKEKKNKNKKG